MTIPSSPNGRRQILEQFQKLPQGEKDLVHALFEQHNCLMVLWGLGDLPPQHLPPVEKRRHLLLAYKALHWIWFDRLPEELNDAFPIHVCEGFPRGQNSENVNQAFATSLTQLEEQCRQMRKPRWASSKVKRLKVSIHSFPYEVQQ
jgi:hypothetical protein